MDVIHGKRELRKAIAQMKLQMTELQRQEESLFVQQQIEATERFSNAQVVLAYWALGDEVTLSPLIENWLGKKQFLLPVVVGNSLELRCHTGVASMVQSRHYGILEPTGSLFLEYEKIDLVIVPGVAFDAGKRRLGRGKGYYDRLLPLLINAYKMGVCFSFQMVDFVPHDHYDHPMDKVITGNSSF
ncbi:5-formyltetrahydrofolate cyclo-ligase [Alkaliflexus imshenetskii]|uniref:5-formyltetrahydrofolate cyclo-ligase n=1 Tax=Alkaliflexus imshenetskii TaxID=286730 RepID=UPI0004B8FDE9|nr:5-formyltetrahydrofolate cyclo-ligase [Alkaliflexus imshenetskii]